MKSIAAIVPQLIKQGLLPGRINWISPMAAFTTLRGLIGSALGLFCKPGAQAGNLRCRGIHRRICPTGLNQFEMIAFLKALFRLSSSAQQSAGSRQFHGRFIRLAIDPCRLRDGRQHRVQFQNQPGTCSRSNFSRC